MPISRRQRHFARRLSGQVLNAVRSRARAALRREQRHEVRGATLVLPPGHHLPYYQRRDPSYDRYAEEVIGALAPTDLTLIDVGANVGDTAVAALQTGDHVRVRAVEGSPAYLPYLRRNLAGFGARAEVVDRFVGPVEGHTTYLVENGTGRFVPAELAAAVGATATAVEQRWIAPSELLADLESGLVVWKSDVDGYDLHILGEHWKAISARCDVLWFEFAPADTWGDPGVLERLVDHLAGSDYALRVYDNLGRPMLRLPPGRAGAQGLADLADWLGRQRAAHVTVPYLDVWAARPPHEAALDVAHTYR